MSHALRVEPLTPEAFRPFGDVITPDGAERRVINEGTTVRFHDLARIDVGAEDGVPLVSIFRGTPRPRPIVIGMLERHPLGSQTFYPLGDRDWLVVAAEGGDAPDLSTLRCFRAGGAAGVNYARGVWHHPLLVLEAGHEFLVIDRGGAGNNLEEIRFDGGDERLIEI